MATPNISGLDAEQLKALIAAAEAELTTKRSSLLTSETDLYFKKIKDAGFTRKEALAEVKKFIKDEAGADEAKPAKKTGGAGKKRPAKYKGPNGETWSGAGLIPKWLAAALASGKKKEDFLA